MKKVLMLLGGFIVAVLALAVFRYNTGAASFIYALSNGGTFLLPLVFFSALLDSVHPCSFSILLITIALLFGMQLPRRKILQIGGVYIAGIFASYFLIGLGLLKVLHLFNTPHLMGKIGSSLLILFGILNILGYYFPNFPIRLRIPAGAHDWMAALLRRLSIPAAFLLGVLVGLCQFPCMGGPYLMVIGLLRDQVTYNTGFLYLLLYNAILSIPLVAVLVIAADKNLIENVQAWKKREMSNAHLVVGIAMIIIGILVLYV